MTITYAVRIDWNGDNDFADTGEELISRVRRRPGVQTTRGRDQVRALAPPAAGRADFELDNQTDDYNPENPASPIASYLYPGHLVQIQAQEPAGNIQYNEPGMAYNEPGVPYDGRTYPLWTGVLDDIPQHPERNRRSVNVPSMGTLSRLAGTKVSTALYQSILTSTALGHLLDAAGWPTADRQIATGQTTLDWWWLDDEDAFAAAVTLMNSEGPGAAIYEDGAGRIVFENKDYRTTTLRCTDSQQGFLPNGTDPTYTKVYEYSPRIKDVINSCSLTAKTRAAGTLAVMWSLGASVVLGASESISYTARRSDSEPFTAAVCVNATDYTVSAGSATVTLSRTSGASVTVTVTAGAGGCTVTGLQVRGQPVTVTGTTQIANTTDASTSIARYGRRPYSLTTRAEIAVNTLQDFANAIVLAYKEPRAMVRIQVASASTVREREILRRQISDRITIAEPTTGNNADFFIERIEHQILSGVHLTTFGCEKAGAAIYGIWDSGLWDTALWGY